jgi:hypothetical protein
LKPSCQRVLIELIDEGRHGVSATRLCNPSIGGIDFRKRVSELRGLGYTVNTYLIPGRPYRLYKLEGMPS